MRRDDGPPTQTHPKPVAAPPNTKKDTTIPHHCAPTSHHVAKRLRPTTASERPPLWPLGFAEAPRRAKSWTTPGPPRSPGSTRSSSVGGVRVTGEWVPTGMVLWGSEGRQDTQSGWSSLGPKRSRKGGKKPAPDERSQDVPGPLS